MKSLFASILFLSISVTCFGQTDSHMQAVNELVEAMHMKEQIEESADRMLKVQMQSMPQMAQYKDVMSDFFAKYINWESLGDDIKQIYKESFTEKELKDLTKFYKSKTGQKLAKIMPEISEKTAMISQGIVMEHQAELQQKIMEAMQDQQ